MDVLYVNHTHTKSNIQYIKLIIKSMDSAGVKTPVLRFMWQVLVFVWHIFLSVLDPACRNVHGYKL